MRRPTWTPRAGARGAVAAAALALSCASSGGLEPVTPPASAELARWMTGSFASTAQAAERPDEFLDVRLYMIPIWTERDDGPWLYVEQAAADALERPYRQRVYRLVDVPGGVRSDVYELPGDPLELAGAWRAPERFSALAPDALLPRAGCSIHLARRDDRWTGATAGEGCASTLRGAARAESEVRITPTTLTSWDRGFDAAGAQVWGAESGPYVFEKTHAQH